MKKGLLISLLILLMGVGMQLMAQERLKFAVYVTGMKDGKAMTDTEEEMSTAHGTASDVMINSGRYEMIERSQTFLKQIREEQRYQQSGIVEDKQIAAIGKANGAQKVCVVQLVIKGKGLMVNVRIVDVETETASMSGRESSSNYTGWLDVEPVVESAVNKMLGNISATPTTNTATSPTGPKANVPEQPKPNSNAMFGSDEVGCGQTSSTAGGTTSGNGGANGYGDGLGIGNAAGSGGGTGGGTGGGSWVKRPNFSSLSADKDFYFEFVCTVDETGKVTNVVKTKDGGAPASLVAEVRSKILNEAKYSPGHPGNHTLGFTFKKN